MAGSKIKLFRVVQIYYARCGIRPTQGDRNFRFNGRNLIILSLLFFVLTSMIIYSSWKAETVAEVSFIILECADTLLVVVAYIIKIWNAEKIFNLIGKYERFIEMSELNPEEI